MKVAIVLFHIVSLKCKINLLISKVLIFLFVCFDSLCLSQQVFSEVWTGLPGLNQF